MGEGYIDPTIQAACGMLAGYNRPDGTLKIVGIMLPVKAREGRESLPVKEAANDG